MSEKIPFISAGTEDASVTFDCKKTSVSACRKERRTEYAVTRKKASEEFARFNAISLWKNNNRDAIKTELSRYNGNLLQTEKRLAELDVGDRFYEKKVDSMNRILDELYAKLDDAQNRLEDIDDEIAMVQKSALTRDSIFSMPEGFSKYYDGADERK